MSQQKSPHEDIILAVIVFGLLTALCWAIWYFFHEQLTGALRWVRVGEMWLAALLVKGDHAVSVPDAGLQSLAVWRDWLPRAHVREIGIPEIVVSTHVAVLPLKYVFAGAIGCMMMWAILMGPGTRYRRRMRLEELIREQARSFPSIAPFTKYDPRKTFRVLGGPVPAKLPLFAEALSPEEWLAFHEVKVQNNQIDLNRAHQALALQLGKRWQGPLKLPLHTQGIYAACALRHARKRKESEALLNEMSMHWTPEGGLRLPSKVKSQIRSVIKDPKLGGALLKYTDKHAFETTAMLRALARAREEGGVMAPATFLWLRGEDRTLWYPLNNLGRKSYHAEAMGALVHYTNELIAGQKIPTPRFEDVIKGMEAYLRSPAARPIPPLDKKMAGGKKK